MKALIFDICWVVITSTWQKNKNIVNFIKNNSNKYIICSNTSLLTNSLNKIIDSIKIWKYFKELLTTEHWSKIENVEYILKKYNLNPKDVLFIDDTINHIISVKKSWVNTLHFTDYDIDIEKEIDKYK